MIKILTADDQPSWIKFHTAAIHSVLGDNVVLHTAESASEAYSLLLENTKEPYDYIFTDMQMETDYLPKMAGEWLIEQIQALSSYYKTRIVIISAAPLIKHIAEKYGVDYIPKRVATASIEPYREILTLKNL